MMRVDWRTMVGGPGLALVAVAAFFGAMRGGPFDLLLTIDALSAVVLVGSCLLAWLPLARSKWPGLAAFVGILCLVGLLFGWSQLRPGVIHPPIAEWGIAAGLVGGLGVVTAIGLDRKRILAGPRPVLAAAIVLLLAVPV